MKTLFYTLFLILISTSVYAGTWCEWSGTEGTNCQSDSKGYILINGFPVKTPAIANSKGFYKLITAKPTITADQTTDTVVWSFANNEIGRTWTVRDLTATELDESIASPMSITDYYLWKTLLTTGVITQAQAIANLPSEMIDAYQARGRLEVP